MVSSSFPVAVTNSKDDPYFQKRTEQFSELFELKAGLGECTANPKKHFIYSRNKSRDSTLENTSTDKRAPPLLREPSRSRTQGEIDVCARRIKVRKDVLALRILWADTRVSLERFSKSFLSEFFIDRCPLCTQFERSHSQNVYSFFSHLISEQHVQALESFFGEISEDHVTFWLDFVKRCVVPTETK
ncbi:hypothetical protein ANCCAN_22995 [Ancylostoma caninum]|uniref:Uncharacterized protein n=1 Tax=Ancylostoma caninum TaxID=29170 RepID=A0A368FK89_ANCCA|nr:hypothetical protein ANCCAN_22995 [Ancylostoma caninum]